MANALKHQTGSPASRHNTSGDLVEVLRVLTHRLSQPLTSLRGSVEVALLGELDLPECRQTLELSLQESHRMAEVLEAVRDVLEMEGPADEASAVSWTQTVKKALQRATFPEGDEGLQLESRLQDDVWVKAAPQPLETATGRLIRRAVETARGDCRVRIGLSVHHRTAYLAVCEESAFPQEDSGGGEFRPRLAPQILEPGGLDEWIVRHAIEQQGGRLRISQRSETCRCYQLNLPTAPLKVAHPAWG